MRLRLGLLRLIGGHRCGGVEQRGRLLLNGLLLGLLDWLLLLHNRLRLQRRLLLCLSGQGLLLLLNGLLLLHGLLQSGLLRLRLLLAGRLELRLLRCWLSLLLHRLLCLRLRLRRLLRLLHLSRLLLHGLLSLAFLLLCWLRLLSLALRLLLNGLSGWLLRCERLVLWHRLVLLLRGGARCVGCSGLIGGGSSGIGGRLTLLACRLVARRLIGAWLLRLLLCLLERERVGGAIALVGVRVIARHAALERRAGGAQVERRDARVVGRVLEQQRTRDAGAVSLLHCAARPCRCPLWRYSTDIALVAAER